MVKENFLEDWASQLHKSDSLEPEHRGMMPMENYKLSDIPRTWHVRQKGESILREQGARTQGPCKACQGAWIENANWLFPNLATHKNHLVDSGP